MTRGSPHVTHLVPALFGVEPGRVLGGAERYAHELAKAMARHVATTLVSFGPEAGRYRDEQLDIAVLGNTRFVHDQPQNPFSWQLFQALAPARVVHCHQQHVLASSAAALYCRVTGRRVFVSDLGGGGWDVSGYVSTDAWYHGHLHISTYSRRVFGHEGRSRAHVIYGGVDTERFAPAPGVARGSDVLYVGRLLPHKGIDELIRGLPNGLTLTIVGGVRDARYAADLERLAAGKAVRFRRDVPDDGLVALYRRALCVVLPSVYRDMYGGETRVPELLGQTLLEGMACGAPAVCTDVASLPEVVEHGVTGFVVPPHDPAVLGERLRWLASHPDRAAAMGRAARERVLRHFTWDRVVARCLDIYGMRTSA